jgi:hypothetical protein
LRDERIINHKLTEAVELGAEGLDIRWKGLRRRTESGRIAADLTISVGGAAVKYNVYLRDEVVLDFQSTDRGRAELAAPLKTGGRHCRGEEGGRRSRLVRRSHYRQAGGWR